MRFFKPLIVICTPLITRGVFWASLFFFGPPVVIHTLGIQGLLALGAATHSGLVDAGVFLLL